MDFKTRPTIKTPITNRFEEAPRRVEVPRPSSPHIAKQQTNIWARAASMVFLLCLLVLVVSLLLILAFGKFDHQNSNFSVSQLVNTNVRQIVAENSASGPTYYVGNLTYLGQDYLVLEDAQQVVYSAADNSSNLKALNCSSPLDGKKLVINRQSVLSWNNVDSSSLLNSATGETCDNTNPKQPQSESNTSTTDSTSTTNPKDSGSTSTSSSQPSSSDTTGAMPVTTEPLNPNN